MIEPINLIAKNIPRSVITLIEDTVVLRALHHERHHCHLEGSGDRREWSSHGRVNTISTLCGKTIDFFVS